VTVTGEIESDEWSLQSESNGVEGVSVLRAPMNQSELWLSDAPAQAAQLTKTIDGDEKSLYRRDRDVEVPLVDVFLKK
jgi:hypothetical protein